MTTRAEREARGRRGEWLAAWFLRLKGWRILGRRLKTPRGEIDLIARRSGTVIFVEVKWRASADQLDHAIDPWRLRRVVAASEAIAHRYVRAGENMRIDVLLLAPGRFPRHLVNAPEA
ncbi:MAG: YraN family protein [Novosphingobium sp.]|nr:YraN family protein [Novosphingobium sp.]